MPSPELASVLQTLWQVLIQLFQLLEVVIKSPLTSLFVGAILAFGGRHIIYGIGLALMIYGALALISGWLGIKLVP
jgi:hypothetical protein